MAKAHLSQVLCACAVMLACGGTHSISAQQDTAGEYGPNLQLPAPETNSTTTRWTAWKTLT